MPNDVTLSIEGMHCEACVRRVTAALLGVDGIKSSSVQVGSAQMTIDPDMVSANDLSAAIGRIGFSAQVIRSSEGPMFRAQEISDEAR
jgi:copper chaperone